jgi:hypothetical protein
MLGFSHIVWALSQVTKGSGRAKFAWGKEYPRTTLSIQVHGMIVFSMFNTVTTRLSIAPPTIAHFRWVWDSNSWVRLMLHYLLQPHINNLPMFILISTNPPDSLSGFNTSANRSMRICRKPMLSTSSAIINTRYHTIFRWETRSSYIYRKSALQGPIRSSPHFFMGLTLSPRLWVVMLLSSTLHPSLDCTECLMWTSFGHIFHHYWTPQRLQNN